MIKLSNCNFNWSTTEKLYPEQQGGKTLYAKKLEFTVSSNNFTVSHGLPSGYTLVHLLGTIKTDTNEYRPIPYANADGGAYNITAICEPTVLRFVIGSSWGSAFNGKPVFIGLIYTKD